MEQEFKKFWSAGIDLASAFSEKFESTITDLVKKGKITADEGKRMVDDFMEKSSVKKQEFEEKYKEFAHKFSKKTAEEELEELRKKIADLEAKIAADKKSNAGSATH